VNDYEVFDLGDVVLHESASLRDAELACKTYETFDEEKSNTVVYSTGTPEDTLSLLRSGHRSSTRWGSSEDSAAQ
jgi:homoserine acetyltransferase